MMTKYKVYVNVILPIESYSEQEAINKAKQKLTDLINNDSLFDVVEQK
ncbi:MAG: hypothetical protein ACTSPM_06970 [Candidatus Heimdallarchaeota archaeon]